MSRRRIGYVRYVLAFGDLATLCLALAAAILIRSHFGDLGFTRHGPLPLEDFLWPGGLALVLTVVVFRRLGLYESGRLRGFGKEAWGTCQAVVFVWAATYVMMNFTHSQAISRSMMGCLLLSWIPLALLDRFSCFIVLTRLRRRGWNVLRAAIIGTERLGQTVVNVLRRNESDGIRPQYFLDTAMAGRQVAGLEVRGPLASLDDVLRQHPVDMVFVALPTKRNQELVQVVNTLMSQSLEVRVVPDLLSLHSLRREVGQLEGLSVVSLTSSPQHGMNSVFKRLFDVAGSLAALAVLAVPMLVIAALIKLTSKGPVFYRQVRESLGGNTFHILKFRTMVPDAEAGSGAVWARKDDPRVTPIGRLLRRTSMDELPQFINVLLGHMSLVGPRPERPELVEVFRKTIPRYMLRSHVKAGLTGWAQVHGLRGRTSLRKRIQYDLYYVTNWSFRLDLLILLMTPFRGLISPHAY